jgi:hypothetical protein
MATSTNQANIWARQYLRDMGYSDDQIGYDKNRNMVMAGGMDFFSPTVTKNGMAYGTRDQLDNAYQTLKYKQGQKQANELVQRFNAALNKTYTPTPFTYDPNSDPQYQAALQQAQQNAKIATGNAMAALNARGIDTSSVMGDRAAQIQQQSLGQVTSEVLPQLVQQAYNRWANEQAMAYQAQQDEIANLMNALGLTNQMNQQMIDNRMNEKNANLNAALAVSDLTGRQITPQSDWGGLFRQAANPNTPLSLAGQQQRFNMDQQQFANDMALREFQENVRQFGLEYALRKAAQDASIANQEAQTALDYQRFLSGGTDGGSNNYNGLTANQALSVLRSQYSVPIYDEEGKQTGTKITSDPEARRQMINQILMMGLPDAVTDQVAASMGITNQEWRAVTGVDLGNR